jgi:hypothetical protein
LARKRTARNAKRNRPNLFLEDASIDRVLAMVLTLSGELWALRERLLVLESVARRKGFASAEELDSYEFSDEEAAQLAGLRRDFLGSLFGLLSAEDRAEVVAPRLRAGKARPRRRR